MKAIALLPILRWSAITVAAAAGSVGSAAAQAPLPGLDLDSLFNEFVEGRTSPLASYSSTACPADNAWTREVVERLSGLELAGHQVKAVALGWAGLARKCDDPIVREWYRQAVVHVDDIQGARAVARGLSHSAEEADIAALVAGVTSPALSERLQTALYRSFMNNAPLEAQAAAFLGSVERGRTFSTFTRDLVALTSFPETRDQVTAGLAELIGANPLHEEVPSILPRIARMAAHPPGSPFETSEGTRRTVLRVLDQFARAPEGSRAANLAARVRRDPEKVRRLVSGG